MPIRPLGGVVTDGYVQVFEKMGLDSRIPRICRLTPSKSSENHLIPVLEPIKYYRATFDAIRPIETFSRLITNGYVKFFKKNRLEALASPGSMG